LLRSRISAPGAGDAVVSRPSLATRFAAIADLPGDSDEDKLRHRLLLFGSLLMSGGGLLWGTIAAIAGLPMESLIPFAYAVITALNFVALAHTKRFDIARVVQIAISLLLPFAFQWVLGGFRSSGVMMIWALMSLIGSLSFSSLGYFSWAFFLFVALTITSGLLEDSLVTPPVLAGEATGTLFFVLNMVVVNSAVFVLIVFFQLGRQRALAEVALKHQELALKKEELAISQTLIQREKMAALGQLVAGIAHELNTPLGAIRASVFNIEKATHEILADLPTLLSAASASDVSGLRRMLDAATSAGAPLTSREERQVRRELAAALAQRGVAEPALIADLLVEIGVRGGVEEHIDTLKAPSGRKLLASAHDLTALQRNSANIRVAADRAAKIVFALKSYAHPGASDGRLESAAIADYLETVVTLYYNQIKHGIDLVRTYNERGEIRARHDEINQVWTNLLHNAVQAMGQRGRLELRIDGDASSVRVSVEDNGPGIPASVMPHLFEPFFTTKAKGEGTGLGLSICRRIVEEHGGRIDVESAPGRTVFSVTLPRNDDAPRPETQAAA